jgi:LysR family transcriptional regulator, nitrogen assimilation regulatory protein
LTPSVPSLEYFLLAADYGSLSKAATVAGIAQPALGRQIQKLERDCGCKLFYRHGRGVTLTVEGERYVERVRPLLGQLKAASQDLQAKNNEVAGSVIVGITPMLLELLGVRLVTGIRRDHPKVALNVVSGYSGYIHEWLIGARLDIAILHDARRSRQIRFDPLADADLYLVSHPDTLSRSELRTKTVELGSIDRYELAVPTRRHGLRRTLDLAASSAGITLNVGYEIDTLPLMKRLVLEKAAHTILALPAVIEELAASRLVARRIVEPFLATSLGLATATNRPLTNAMRTVIRAIRTGIEEAITESKVPLGFHLSPGTLNH